MTLSTGTWFEPYCLKLITSGVNPQVKSKLSENCNGINIEHKLFVTVNVICKFSHPGFGLANQSLLVR